MIVNVSIDRVVHAKTLEVADIRALRSAVVAAVQAHVARATAQSRVPPAAIQSVSRAIATEVTTRCSRAPARPKTE